MLRREHKTYSRIPPASMQDFNLDHYCRPMQIVTPHSIIFNDIQLSSKIAKIFAFCQASVLQYIANYKLFAVLFSATSL